MRPISAVLAEANDIYKSLTEAKEEDSNIANALETAEEVGQEVKTLKGESINSTTARLLKLSLESLLGNTIFEDAGIEFNADEGADSATVERVEEVSQVAVREFWLAYKSSFNSVWGTTKQWHSTIEKAANDLTAEINDIIAKAAKINERAREPYFEFTKYKDIAIKDELNFSMLNNGVKDLNSILTSCLNVRNTSEFESFIQTASDTVEAHMKNPNGRPDDSWIARFRDIYHPGKDIKLNEEIDEKVFDGLSLLSRDAINVAQTPVMPGNITIFYCQPKPENNLSFTEKINSLCAEFVSVKKEDETEPQSIKVATLHPEQINDVCKISLELLEHVQFYDKAWERRAKFMDRMIKDIDKAVNTIVEVELTDVDRKFYKRAVFAIMNAIKSHNSYIATLLNMVLRICVGVVYYCKASMSQFSNPSY